MEQENNQNIDAGQPVTNSQQQVDNQSVSVQPQENTVMPQQPVYAQTMQKKPLLDDSKVELLNKIGTSGGVGFCFYLVIRVFLQILSGIYEGVSSYDLKSTILDIYNFISTYVLIYVPIIITGALIVLLLKYKKK